MSFVGERSLTEFTSFEQKQRHQEASRSREQLRWEGVAGSRTLTGPEGTLPCLPEPGQASCSSHQSSWSHVFLRKGPDCNHPMPRPGRQAARLRGRRREACSTGLGRLSNTAAGRPTAPPCFPRKQLPLDVGTCRWGCWSPPAAPHGSLSLKAPPLPWEVSALTWGARPTSMNLRSPSPLRDRPPPSACPGPRTCTSLAPHDGETHPHTSPLPREGGGQSSLDAPP